MIHDFKWSKIRYIFCQAMTQFAKSFIQKHNQKLQVILTGLIFCVGIYGIWTKNSVLIGATTVTFASVGLFFLTEKLAKYDQ